MKDGFWKIISFNSDKKTITGIFMSFEGTPVIGSEGSIVVEELEVPEKEFDILLFLSEKTSLRSAESLEARKLLNQLLAEKIMNDYFQGLIDAKKKGVSYDSDIFDRASSLFQMK